MWINSKQREIALKIIRVSNKVISFSQSKLITISSILIDSKRVASFTAARFINLNKSNVVIPSISQTLHSNPVEKATKACQKNQQFSKVVQNANKIPFTQN